MKNRLLILAFLLVFHSMDITSSGAGLPEESVDRSAKETIIFVPSKDMQSVLEIEQEGIFVGPTRLVWATGRV